MPASTIPASGDPRVDAALSRIREKFTDLEDAMIVHAHLEKRSSERLNDHDGLLDNHAEVLKSTVEVVKLHADLLRSHEEHLRLHKENLRSHEEWLIHISDKLDALTDIVMRRAGGSEARA